MKGQSTSQLALALGSCTYPEEVPVEPDSEFGLAESDEAGRGARQLRDAAHHPSDLTTQHLLLVENRLRQRGRKRSQASPSSHSTVSQSLGSNPHCLPPSLELHT